MGKITRRDFVNGTLMAAGASTLPFAGTSQAVMAALEPSYYPPARTGLRGSHPGSDQHAHSRACAGRTDWGTTTNLQEEYDLVVVGCGFSGSGFKHSPATGWMLAMMTLRRQQEIPQGFRTDRYELRRFQN